MAVYKTASVLEHRLASSCGFCCRQRADVRRDRAAGLAERGSNG